MREEITIEDLTKWEQEAEMKGLLLEARGYKLAREKIQSLETMLSKAGKTCSWMPESEDDDYWETECGHACTINEGTPEENEMNYCAYCGGKLITNQEGE